MSGAGVPTHIGSRDAGIRWRELWAYRELLYFMVWRDVKVRYKQTVLGAAWAMLQPLLTMVIFTVVFGRWAWLPSEGRPYALFSLVALVPWTYFANAVTSGSMSLVNGQQLVSKVYFPRLLLPAAAITTPLVDLGIAFGLIAAGLLWYGQAPTPALLLLPVFVLLAVGAALATALWLSALHVEYRDIRYVVPFLLQIWMFATPVAYAASLVPERWRLVYGLNPMVTVVEGFRWALLGTAPSAAMAGLSTTVVVISLVGGFMYFRHVERTVADVL